MNNTIDPGGRGTGGNVSRWLQISYRDFVRGAQKVWMGVDGNLYRVVQLPGQPVVRVPEHHPAAVRFRQMASSFSHAHLPTSTSGGLSASSQATATTLPRLSNPPPLQDLNAAGTLQDLSTVATTQDLNAAAMLIDLNAGKSQKAVLEALILQKDARYPESLHNVFDADQCGKILFLALHPIPFETIAYVLRLESGGESRDKETLARLGNIIAHYLPQIMMQEAALKPDAVMIVSDLFSRAELGVWTPRMLQHAADYIWEEADEQRLYKLGYRKDSPEAEKAIMLQRLVFLQNAGNWRGVLDIHRRGIVE